MSDTTAPGVVATPVALPTIAVGAVLPWLAFAVLLLMVAFYFVGAEQGATSVLNGTAVHEWVHDGRHLLGFPATEGSVTARSFLVRGLLAGLLAGIVAFAVGYVVGEPSLNASIALEDTSTAGPASSPGPSEHSPGVDGHSHGDEEHSHAGSPSDAVVPRSLQSTAGLLTGTVVAGVTLGGLVGVLSALALGRFGSLGPRATTVSVAATGFVALYVVPSWAFPPTPPAGASGDSIGYRTALYFILMAVSVLALVVAVLAGRRLATRWGGWYATLAAGLGYLAIVTVAIALLPAVDEVPADFPATVLYEFRRASFLTQLALWTTLGVVLADLVGRLTDRARPVAQPVAPQPGGVR